jgi:hypothetical protein
MHSLIVNEALVAFSLAGMARNLKHLNLSIAQHQRQILIHFESGIFQLLSQLMQVFV